MGYYVYIHTCKDNGKKYVGVTTKRKPEYRWLEGRGYQYNDHFYKAILKHGWNNFQHEVLEVESEEEMYRKEVELISFYHSNDPKFGYNNSAGGEKSALGCKCSEETRRKISKANKGRVFSEEVRRKNSEARKKRWLDPEYRKHMSEAHKGKSKPHSEETKRHLSEVAKNRPRIKIKLPDETVIERNKLLRGITSTREENSNM